MDKWQEYRIVKLRHGGIPLFIDVLITWARVRLDDNTAYEEMLYDVELKDVYNLETGEAIKSLNEDFELGRQVRKLILNPVENLTKSFNKFLENNDKKD
jgi:hypothetical protein